jgi:hypothetical protein
VASRPRDDLRDDVRGEVGPEVATSEGGVALSARAQFRPSTPLSGGWAVLAGYRVGEAVSVNGGALIGGSVKSPTVGALLRADWAPVNAGGTVRPVIGAEIPLLFTGGFAPGIGASAGVEIAPSKSVAIALEAPVYYFLSGPPGGERLYVFVATRLSIHL